MEAVSEEKWSDISVICSITLYLWMSEYDGVVMETRQPDDMGTFLLSNVPLTLIAMKTWGLLVFYLLN